MRHATSEARHRGAALLILRVAEPPFGFYGAEVYAGKPDPSDPVMLEALKRVVPTDDSVEYEHCVRAGDPAQEILAFAEERQVQMIVMATHGHKGLRLLLHGSVTEYVVRRATRPVLVIHANSRPSNRIEALVH